MTDKIGRNDPCSCGSGKKYKQCCLTKQRPGTRRKFTAKVLGVKPKSLESAEPTPVPNQDLIERTFSPLLNKKEEEQSLNPPEA